MIKRTYTLLNFLIKGRKYKLKSYDCENAYDAIKHACIWAKKKNLILPTEFYELYNNNKTNYDNGHLIIELEKPLKQDELSFSKIDRTYSENKKVSFISVFNNK